MGKRINAQQMENIITRVKVFGDTRAQVAKDIGFTENTVGSIVTAFDLTRDKNWPEIISRVERDLNIPAHFYWAAEKLGVEVPKEQIESAYRKLLDSKSAKKDEVVKTVEKKEERNDALFMIKILEALNKQNELLEQLMDVVIPKYVSDMKDNVNANADVICERLKNSEQSLDKISYNTRKRGA